jgi:hypothetical protein
VNRVNLISFRPGNIFYDRYPMSVSHNLYCVSVVDRNRPRNSFIASSMLILLLGRMMATTTTTFFSTKLPPQLLWKNYWLSIQTTRCGRSVHAVRIVPDHCYSIYVSLEPAWRSFKTHSAHIQEPCVCIYLRKSAVLRYTLLA